MTAMSRNLIGQLVGGLAVVAVVLGAWCFPAAILFPVMMTLSVWGLLLGPLLAAVAGCGLFLLRGRSTVWDWVLLCASAGLWAGSGWWNLHAFAAGYYIRIDFLALIPAMWAALLIPLVVVLRRMWPGQDSVSQE